MMVFFDEEPRQRTHIEIIPMIDVMMFLMVFFVMISLNVIPVSGLNSPLKYTKILMLFSSSSDFQKGILS